MIKFSFNQRFVRKQLEAERGRMFRMAVAWCGDRHLADDLTQQAMIKALEKSNQLKDTKAFRGWMYRILSNAWHDHLRSLKPESAIDPEMLICDGCPERAFETNLVGEVVRRAIGKLPLAQREVVTLVDLEGFSYREVAEIVGVPTGTVMSRLSRARKKLEVELSRHALQPVESPAPLRRVK
ncbi:MAG: RNA polymerase sigma factor [bacterium]